MAGPVAGFFAQLVHAVAYIKPVGHLSLKERETQLWAFAEGTHRAQEAAREGGFLDAVPEERLFLCVAFHALFSVDSFSLSTVVHRDH